MEALSEAATGGVVIVPSLKPAVEVSLSKPLALSALSRSWQIKAIHTPTHQRVRRGNKLPERLTEEMAAFVVPQPTTPNVSGRSTFRPNQ